MGLFNVVVVRAKCPWCGKESTMEVQFKYGKLWQYRYRLGDALTWPIGSNKANKKKRVKVSGVAIPCRYCVKDFIDFEIVVDDNIIASVTPVIIEEDAANP